MKGNKSSLFLIFLLICMTFAPMLNIQNARANFMPMPTPQPAIIINNDGTISPTSAPILRSNDIFTLTDDIEGYTLAIERDNIVIDGLGHSLRGTNNYAGIFVQEHNKVTIQHLNISGFNYGILFTWSSYGSNSNNRSNIITNNNLYNNTYGIYINDFSTGNKLANNSLTSNTNGIYFGSCSNNQLKNNNMTNNTKSFFIYGTSAVDTNDIDQTNTIDGKPIIYWINQQNKEAPTDLGYLALVNCTNMTLHNLTLENKGQGMLLVKLTNSQITQNKITNNDNGLWLIESENNTITQNTIEKNRYDAIYLSSSPNNKITNNIFRNNGLNGTPAAQVLGSVGQAAIWLTNSRNNIIEKNIIMGNGEGIDLQSSTGNLINNNFIAETNGTALHLYDSTDNRIIGNNITNNKDWAIKLWSSNQNTVQINNIANNAQGILLEAAAENNIIENNFINNTAWGMRLESASDKFMSSTNNNIYHNNFIDNQNDEGLDVSIPGIWTYPAGYIPGVANKWDNGKEGNYWSEYKTRYPNATEKPGTTVWNTAWEINENNVDYYPLTKPSSITELNEIVIPTNSPKPTPVIINTPLENPTNSYTAPTRSPSPTLTDTQSSPKTSSVEENSTPETNHTNFLLQSSWVILISVLAFTTILASIIIYYAKQCTRAPAKTIK